MRQALSDVMAKMAPKADVERTAAFVRGLYENAIRDERDERDRLLAGAQSLVGASVAAPPAAGPREPTTQPQVPLAVLDRAKVPLAFPSEEEAQGVDFTGRIIDNRYQVLRKIGEGGMGTVYVGEHVEIGKGVAIKILHPAFSHQSELVERFRREARAASRIGHPNIIDVTDFGSTEEGCAYFVMEYLDGIDLADILSHERRLEHTRACQIAIQICRALAAAHAAGVVHRDLKPENVFLVSRDGKADFVKVLDFGIARSAGRSRRLTNPGIAMGTPEYMAPEQASGGVVDQRSDIYSVGALLYEMVTGSPPQFRNKEMVAPRVLRNELPDEIDRTIVRALEPDPDRRYQSMTQLEYDIVKGLWGRARAVNELLGLRVMRRRAETTRRDTPIAEAVIDALAAPRLGPTPASGLYALERAVGRASPGTPAAEEPPPPAAPPRTAELPRGPRTVANLRAEPPAPAGMSAGRRFAATFAVLALVAAVAAAAYRRLPWNARASAAAALPAVAAQPIPAVRTEAERRAERVQAGAGEIERRLGAGIGFGEVVALEGRLGRLRADGGVAIANALAVRAETTLIKAAEEELDQGRVADGIAHYKLALGLDAGSGRDRLPSALRARAATALAAHDTDAAVRWARELVSLSDGDAAAHALLADALHAGHEDEEAVAEYKKAIADDGDDPELARGLERAQQQLRSNKRHTARAARAARAGRKPARRYGGDARRRPPPGTRTALPAQRRPSRLPSSSSSCIARARSPSISRRPSNRGCMGGMAPERSPSKVDAVETQRRARPARLHPRLAEADVERPAPPPLPVDLEQQASGDLAHEIDVARVGEQHVPRRPAGGHEQREVGIGPAESDAQVGRGLTEPDVGRRAPGRRARTARRRRRASSHAPPSGPEMLARTVGVPAGARCPDAAKASGSQRSKNSATAISGGRPIPTLHRE